MSALLLGLAACGNKTSSSSGNNSGTNGTDNGSGTNGGSSSGSGNGGGTSGGGSGSGQAAATYLYVANAGPDNNYFTESSTPETISILKVDPNTSQMTLVGGYGDESKWIANQILVAGQWVLASRGTGAAFSEMKIDSSTGELSDQKDLTTGQLFTVSPDGKFVVLLENGNFTSYSIDQSSGALTKVSSTAETCSAVPVVSQWDPTGQYFAPLNCDGTVVKVSSTGQISANATNADQLDASAQPVGFNTSGTHFVAVKKVDQGGQVLIYDFDPNTGSLTFSGNGPSFGDGTSYAIGGDYLYVRGGTGTIYKMGGTPFGVTDTGQTFNAVSGWSQPFIVDLQSNTAFIVQPQSNQVSSLRVGSDGGLKLVDSKPTGTAPWVMAVAHF
ncbi:MAG: hypothetical protein ROO76_14950 [Terriglobia bacterium]|nr:hypothetical protein [Terriglobia bacterium]